MFACICGGILEIGAIIALVGFFGKRLHKCNCHCHELHKCKHCSDEHVNVEKIRKKNVKYNVIQLIFALITIVGLCIVGYSLVKEHNEHHHHHIEMKN